MADFDPPFANAASRRVPTLAELSGGFACGDADQELFNWLMWAFFSELGGVQTKSGITPDNADMLQLAKAVRSQAMNYRTASGTANALTITLDPAPTSYADLSGTPLVIAIAAANTGAVTLDVNSLGARSFVKSNGAEFTAGEMRANTVRVAYYHPGLNKFIVAAADQYEIAARLNAGKTTTKYNPGTHSWTCPAGVYFVEVEGWAGGGSGGGAGSTNAKAAGGGGGAYFWGIVPVVPGTTYTIVVGAGGAGVGSGFTGNAGGTTSFGGTLLVATGGGGGLGANNNVTAIQVGGGTATADVSVIGAVLISGALGAEGSIGTGGGSPRGGPPQTRAYTTGGNNNQGNAPGGGSPGSSDYSGFSQSSAKGGDGLLILRYAA